MTWHMEILIIFPESASHKVFRDKAFNIVKNPKYDGYQRGFASVVYKFLDKRSSTANNSGGAVTSGIMPKQQLAEELHKSVVKKFAKQQYTHFEDNIWGSDLADMQLIRKSNKDFYYVLFISIVDMHGSFLWKTKRVLQSLMLFKKF